MDIQTDKYGRKIFRLKTNHAVVNTLRRTIFQDVPSYAFDPAQIVFQINTTIYHNDYMRKRISNIPVFGVKNDYKQFELYLKDNYDWVINHIKPEEKPVNAADKDPVYDNIDVDTFEADTDTHVLTMYCHKKHDSKTDEFVNVTTDDCEFTLNNKKVSNPYQNPMLLCKLRFGEEIKFSATSKYSIPYESPIWNVMANCFFVEKSDEEYDFYIIKREIDEEDVLKRARTVIIEKIKNILEILKSKEEISTQGELKIENDKFTIPALLTYYLQDHPEIEFCGYKAEHLLADTSVIYYRARDGSDMEKILKEVSQTIIRVLESKININK